MKILAFSLSIAVFAFAAEQKPQKSVEQIRVLPVKRTPESETSTAVISIPKNGALMKGNPVWVQTRIEGYPIGASSQFDRADEIAVSKKGQTIHVVLDDQPYFPVYEPALDPFNEEGWYYETSYKFELPKVGPGEHLLRVFLARSYGECLKGEWAYSAITFNVGTAPETSNYDLSKPYLTYNEPSNQLYLEEDKPILLDFYISNCELSTDGYKVRLTVDGSTSRTLTAWQPYYIYGLKKGNHTIRLDLINSRGKLVSSPLGSAQQTITVH
ncbi:MAG TPA: hypothetical protein VHL30_03735 [Chlamydiales bacterium]|jgi:hypothetical protein|nr:hypothetical protein [Chlamydiales bacterium]